MQPLAPRLQFHQVLLVLQMLEQIAAGGLLSAGEVFEDSMSFEYGADISQRCLQPRGWRPELHAD